METVEFAKATLPLSDYTKKVKKEPFIITKKGKPVAALVSITNADIETVSLSTHPRFIALIERSRAKQKAGGGNFHGRNASAAWKTKAFGTRPITEHKRLTTRSFNFICAQPLG